MTDVKRKSFDLTLTSTPPDTFRLVVGEEGIPSENILLSVFYDLIKAQLDTYTQAEIATILTNYLAKTNSISYTPTQNYHPATKKYVDDGGLIIPWTNCNTAPSVTLTNCKASQVGVTVYVTGQFSHSSVSTGALILTLPSTIAIPTIDIYGTSSVKGANVATTPIQIEANTRNMIMQDGGNSGITYSFLITYPAI